MELFVFVVASLMIVGGAVGVIVRSNPVHAAMSLILTLFGVAVLFVAMEAHFLAAVQVIVYAGAIVVLFLFVIMLLGVDRAENLRIEPIPVQRPLAVVVAIGLVTTIGAAIIHSRVSIRVASGDGLEIATQTGDGDSNLRQLARDLFSDQVFSFELTSALLVVAVVGTVLMLRRPSRSERVSGAQAPEAQVTGTRST
jgi:NADH-quinone oxidoreductase subunit J